MTFRPIPVTSLSAASDSARFRTVQPVSAASVRTLSRGRWNFPSPSANSSETKDSDHLH